MAIKLKDFKDKPEQYQEILNICRRKGIQVDDEFDISALIGKINSFNKDVNSIVNGSSGSRSVINGKGSTKLDRSIINMIATGANRK